MKKILNNDYLVKIVGEGFSFSSVVSFSTFKIKEDEFLICLDFENGVTKFQHLYFDRKNKDVLVKYTREYIRLNDNDIKFNGNLVILDEFDRAIIYNYDNGNSFVVNNYEIMNANNLDKESVIIKNDIRSGESIIFSVDSEILDVDRIYSVMQDRFIPVIKDGTKSLEERMSITLRNEIYHYLEYIEDFEKQFRNKKITRACKKLIKKHENK